MAAGKNQHYVSQFYLKRFKTPESREGKERIHTYDLVEDKYIGNQLIANVASENRFFGVPGDDTLKVDDQLTALETRAGPLLHKLVEAETAGVLTYSDMHDLAFFLAAQHYRTRKFRDLGTNSLKGMLAAANENPEAFKEFIRENSLYTRPQIEKLLSSIFMDIATRRLEVLGLSTDERERRLPELDEELRLYEAFSADMRAEQDLYAQGQVSEHWLESTRRLVENPKVIHAWTVAASVSKLAQRLLSMEWSVQRYADDAYRYTSDNPLMLFSLAVPAFEEDARARLLLGITMFGKVDFFLDELMVDYPPMAFILPLTPHLDLVAAPHGVYSEGGEMLAKRTAFKFNVFLVGQAHRFIFSANGDFSTVAEAVKRNAQARQVYEEIIPAWLMDNPEADMKLSPAQRWRWLHEV